jgi:hypothetical protein
MDNRLTSVLQEEIEGSPLPISIVLQKIQSELKAPKSQHNSFGNYNYRNCEDILEALKPMLAKYQASVVIRDSIEQIGDRFYIKATASLICECQEISVSAYAREAQEKKGMDVAQITGATSSYARKYALNGLFAIDDSKDPDATNTGNNGKITEEHLSILRNCLLEIEEPEDKLCKVLKVETLDVLPDNRFKEADEAIKARKAKKVSK